MKLPGRNFLHLAAGAAALPAVPRFTWAHAYAVVIGTAIVLFASALLPQPASAAGFVVQGPKLVGAGPTGASQPGLSAAISADGNTAIIGGPGDRGALDRAASPFSVGSRNRNLWLT